MILAQTSKARMSRSQWLMVARESASAGRFSMAAVATAPAWLARAGYGQGRVLTAVTELGMWSQLWLPSAVEGCIQA